MSKEIHNPTVNPDILPADVLSTIKEMIFNGQSERLIVSRILLLDPNLTESVILQSINSCRPR